MSVHMVQHCRSLQLQAMNLHTQLSGFCLPTTPAIPSPLFYCRSGPSPPSLAPSASLSSPHPTIQVTSIQIAFLVFIPSSKNLGAIFFLSFQSLMPLTPSTIVSCFYLSSVIVVPFFIWNYQNFFIWNYQNFAALFSISFLYNLSLVVIE